MKANLTAIRSIQIAGIMLLASSGTVAAVESGNGRPVNVEIVTTNWVERALTNVVEIQIPKLVIVDQFHTNTTVSFATNIVEVQRTQWVDKFETNVIYALNTNWVTMTQTNVVARDQYRTNVIDVVTTNFFTAYQTNRTTLSITNWDTVLVMKTNWITQPVTNVAAIDLPAPRSTSVAPTPSTPAVPETSEARKESAHIAPAADKKNLVLEWARESKNPTEIVITLKSVNEAETTVQVQEWRVERSDAAILLMGRDPEFRAELPVGTYNVTVKARYGSKGRELSLSGSIEVTPDEETHQVLVAAAN